MRKDNKVKKIDELYEDVDMWIAAENAKFRKLLKKLSIEYITVEKAKYIQMEKENTLLAVIVADLLDTLSIIEQHIRKTIKKDSTNGKE